MQILVTGASGFVGTNLIKNWSGEGQLIPCSLQDGIGKLSNKLKNIDTIVHLAGIAHRMEKTNDEIYFQVNEELTVDFASLAKKCGVSHFIFLSTIKVYGDKLLKQTVTEDTQCEPTDAYSQSKLNAENKLKALEDDRFIVSIIRPPLIFGAGVKGNLLRLMKLAGKPIPLPLGGIKNHRAMISIDNLNAMIMKLIKIPASGIFIPQEDCKLSTQDLVTEIRFSMGFKSPALISIPMALIKILKKYKPEIHQRLYGSLHIDNHKSLKALNFKNPHSTIDGIKKMVAYFISH